MTIYLIDYENVHDGGLKDSGNVPEDSKILLFFSNNEDKITMGNLMPIVSRLSLYKTRAGKQSLDMHLASYLGHEIGINGNEHKYIIVSKDHDYDNVAMYWKDQGIDVSVQGALVIAQKPEPEKDRQAQEQNQNQNQIQNRNYTQNNRNRNQAWNGRGRRQTGNSTAAQTVVPEASAVTLLSAETEAPEKDKISVENTISIAIEENIPAEETSEKMVAEKEITGKEVSEIEVTEKSAAGSNITAEEKTPTDKTVPEKAVLKEEISKDGLPKKELSEEESLPRKKTPDEEVEKVPDPVRNTKTSGVSMTVAEPEADTARSEEVSGPVPTAESAQEETPDHTETASRRGNYQRRNNQGRNNQSRNNQGRNTRGSQNTQPPKEPAAQKNGGQQPTEKTILNNKMMTKLTEAKLDAATVGKLTATIMKQFGKSNFRQLTYREIIKACGMQRGLEVYGLVKKIL